MLFKEINKVYTEKIKSYLNNGFTINAGTMSGSQGEIAAIDLTTEDSMGNIIVRIYMDTFYGGEKRCEHLRGIKIVTGVVTEPIDADKDARESKAIWNERLKVSSEIRFYVIGKEKENGKTWYGTYEEAKAAQNKMLERYKIDGPKDTHVFPEAAHKIIIPYIKRQSGYKRVGLSSIEKVYSKVSYSRFNDKTSKHYYALVGNRELCLK